MMKIVEKSLYNPEFVKKIKSQEGQTGVKINIEDLYTDAPPDVEEAFARSVRIKDFLPPPEFLVLKKSNKQTDNNNIFRKQKRREVAFAEID